MKITARGDCGNSPKNRTLQGLTIAWAEGALEELLSGVTDEIRWEIAGGTAWQGKALEQMGSGQAEELVIQ